jgi:hypothetical protein
MDELLDAVTSPWNLVLALAVFGFAPGFFLRLIVLTYPCDAPRRKELIAELYTIPRRWRPFWVAEQLEVGLFEGLPQRISAINVRRKSRAETDNRKRGISSTANADPLHWPYVKYLDTRTLTADQVAELELEKK